MITNYLPEDPLAQEQMLYDMLDTELSVTLTRREYRERITAEPWALGHSPEVGRLIAEAETAGVVWGIRHTDGLVWVSHENLPLGPPRFIVRRITPTSKEHHVQ